MIIECPNCGAQIETNGIRTVCDFCGTPINVPYKGENNTDYIIKNNVIIKYKGHSQYVDIPEGIEVLSNKAFQGNENIHEVILPSTLKYIQDDCFSNCFKLQKVAFNNGLREIGDNAFRHTAIREIVLPESVVYIGENAFFECGSLKRVIVNNESPFIGNSAFKGCIDLKDVQLDFSLCLYPSLLASNKGELELRGKPTYYDVFSGTAFIGSLKKNFYDKETKKCLVCGGNVIVGLLHARCTKCGFKN